MVSYDSTQAQVAMCSLPSGISHLTFDEAANSGPATLQGLDEGYRLETRHPSSEVPLSMAFIKEPGVLPKSCKAKEEVGGIWSRATVWSVAEEVGGSPRTLIGEEHF